MCCFVCMVTGAYRRRRTAYGILHGLDHGGEFGWKHWRGNRGARTSILWMFCKDRINSKCMLPVRLPTLRCKDFRSVTCRVSRVVSSTVGFWPFARRPRNGPQGAADAHLKCAVCDGSRTVAAFQDMHLTALVRCKPIARKPLLHPVPSCSMCCSAQHSPSYPA